MVVLVAIPDADRRTSLPASIADAESTEELDRDLFAVASAPSVRPSASIAAPRPKVSGQLEVAGTDCGPLPGHVEALVGQGYAARGSIRRAQRTAG